MRQQNPLIPLRVWAGALLVTVIVASVNVWALKGASAPHPGGWPEWTTAIATAVLAIATATLAGAAIVALRELNEAKRDRHAQVFADIGRRWDDPPMAEALQAEAVLTKEELAELAARALPPEGAPQYVVNAAMRADAELVVLLRVPNFFEDLMLITEEGGINMPAMSRNFKGLANAEWKKWEKAIGVIRERNDEYAFTQFEKLVKEMNRLPDE